MYKKLAVFVLAALCAVGLSGCGGTPESTGFSATENISGENKDENDGEKFWVEEFDAVTPDGEAVKISIEAEVQRPADGFRNAVVCEVAEKGFDKEYKKMVLKCFFGTAPIYLYNSDGENFAQPADDNFENDAYVGYKDGIMFGVFFQEYMNELPKEEHLSILFRIVGPDKITYPVRHKSVLIRPLDLRDAVVQESGNKDITENIEIFECPDEYKDAEIEAAQEIADRFIKDMGLNFCGYDYINNGRMGSFGKLMWNFKYVDSGEHGNISVGCGFNYVLALDGEGKISSMGYSDSVLNQWSGKADTENPIYSGECFATVYVKDGAVIYAEINNPVEMVSVTEHVGILPYGIIKDIIRGELAQNTDKYIAPDSKRTGVISFENMDFKYMRVRDSKREGIYSYVPVWSLIGWSEGWNGYGAEYIIYINAIDGTPIDITSMI